MGFPRTAIAELVGRLARVQCVWVEQRNAQLGADGGPQAWIELVILADVPVGDGEYRRTPNENNPDAFDASVTLYKLVTVSLRAKSFEADLPATDLLATVRARLSGVTAAEVYACENIAFVRTHPIAGVRSSGSGNRVRLEATMDVVWSALDGGPADDDDGRTFATATPPVLTGG